jgi:hypothetical protein
VGRGEGGERVMMETLLALTAFAVTAWLGWESQFRLAD